MPESDALGITFRNDEAWHDLTWASRRKGHLIAWLQSAGLVGSSYFSLVGAGGTDEGASVRLPPSAIVIPSSGTRNAWSSRGTGCSFGRNWRRTAFRIALPITRPLTTTAPQRHQFVMIQSFSGSPQSLICCSLPARGAGRLLKRDSATAMPPGRSRAAFELTPSALK